MPLPPALAARLAKRGIIKKAEAAKEEQAAQPTNEAEIKSTNGKVLFFVNSLIFIDIYFCFI